MTRSYCLIARSKPPRPRLGGDDCRRPGTSANPYPPGPQRPMSALLSTKTEFIRPWGQNLIAHPLALRAQFAQSPAPAVQLPLPDQRKPMNKTAIIALALALGGAVAAQAAPAPRPPPVRDYKAAP